MVERGEKGEKGDRGEPGVPDKRLGWDRALPWGIIVALVVLLTLGIKSYSDDQDELCQRSQDVREGLRTLVQHDIDEIENADPKLYEDLFPQIPASVLNELIQAELESLIHLRDVTFKHPSC